MSNLYDQHSTLFRKAFEEGLSFQHYLGSASSSERARWMQSYESARLSDEQRSLLAAFRRKQNILVLSGIWCGDCARSCPLLVKIAEATSTISLRFVESRSDPTLVDELRIHGASRVPVVVTLSEDYFEVSRFGDRTLSVYRRKASEELGPSCAIGGSSSAALDAEIADWVSHVERSELMLRLSGLLRARYND